MSGVATAIAASAVIGGVSSRNASKKAANAQKESGDAAIAEQRRSKEEALGYYSPYADLGGLGLDQAGFLTDSQAQYDWLQNNPLFQMSLDNANDVTSKMGAASGRLSAGDTLMQLQNNGLLAAMPLINDQKNSISNLVNFGAGMTNAQANAALGVGNNISNIMTQQGNAMAGGIMGANNANMNMLNGLTGAFTNYMAQPSAPAAATGGPGYNPTGGW